jgi:hypothetical protein
MLKILNKKESPYKNMFVVTLYFEFGDADGSAEKKLTFSKDQEEEAEQLFKIFTEVCEFYKKSSRGHSNTYKAQSLFKKLILSDDYAALYRYFNCSEMIDSIIENLDWPFDPSYDYEYPGHPEYALISFFDSEGSEFLVELES